MPRDNTIRVATPEERLETRRQQAKDRDRRSWNEAVERVAAGLPAEPEPEPEVETEDEEPTPIRKPRRRSKKNA